MMSIILPFTIFAISQVGTPGPANMVLLSTGAKYGLKRAIPFVLGVIFGKQLIIWPIGFGLIGVLSDIPIIYLSLKLLSAIYIIWLSYKILNLRISVGDLPDTPPGFLAGLIVHPLNPKAWGMIITGYSSFIPSEIDTIFAILIISIILIISQLILHPLWCWGGHRLSLIVRGKSYEKYLMWLLAFLTLMSVFYALYKSF